MSSLNKVALLGNVGKDPEIRSLQNGNRIANLALATNESWVDKQSGERKQKVEWHRVVVFNEHLVDVIEKFVTKGKQIYIEGALQTRKWTDQSGQEKFTTEVVLQKFRGELVLLGSNEEGGERRREPEQRSEQRPAQSRGNQSDPGRNKAPSWDAQRKNDNSDLDDDIPF